MLVQVLRKALDLPISDKGTDLSSAHQRQDKPDEYCCSYQLGHIYVGFSAQGVKYTLCPVGEVELLENEAVAPNGMRGKRGKLTKLFVIASGFHLCLFVSGCLPLVTLFLKQQYHFR